MHTAASGANRRRSMPSLAQVIATGPRASAGWFADVTCPVARTGAPWCRWRGGLDRDHAVGDRLIVSRDGLGVAAMVATHGALDHPGGELDHDDHLHQLPDP